MSSDEEEFAARLRSQVLDAFGLEPREAGLAPVPPGEVPLIDWDSYNAAEAEYLAQVEAFRAALPGRMQDAADEVNRQFADVLPEGMRFEYGPQETS
jgi:hypothetical protein